MALDKRPFNPIGKTILVAADTTAPAGVQAIGAGSTAPENYRLQNNGSDTAFMAYGVDANSAQSNAVIPTGTSQNCFPLPPGAIEVVSAPINCYWSAIVANTASNVYVTPGMGF